jgi:hypothetical protein
MPLRPNPAPLPAIQPRRYNPSVPATHTTPVRRNMLLFGRIQHAIGHYQQPIEIPPGSRIENLFAHRGAFATRITKPAS